MNEHIKGLVKHIPTAIVTISVLASSFMGYRFYQLSALVIQHEAKLTDLQARFPELVITVVNEAIKQQQNKEQ